MDELKPCPFCGCEDVTAEVSYADKEFRIYCCNTTYSCPAEMRLSFTDVGVRNGATIDFAEMQTIMEELVYHWNRRHGCGEAD